MPLDPLTILQGDVLARLRELPDASIHCCITSPPYWGLRDYGTATWEGGDPACDHKQGRPGAGRADGVVDDRAQRNRDGVGSMGGDCKRCGARRIDSQIGLEETPDAYVARLVEVFREVRRVLRDDGTLWLNLGDSYFGDSPVRKASSEAFSETWDATQTRSRGGTRRSAQSVEGLKPKDLVGIPWRVAFALQADGWWLRQDIIWHKPNPMPESVTDRCTKSHEYIFLLTKAARYFYDAEAIKEPSSGVAGGGFSRAYAEAQPGHGAMHMERPADTGARNRRDVWTVATQPYPEAHFATWPEDLVKPMVMAGCPEGGRVLDPFAGSGTTGAVALKLGRAATLIELNPAYVDLIARRCRVTLGLPGLC